MRVLTQDRSHIIKLPASIWVEKSNNDLGHYLVVCSNKTARQLGVYKDEMAACQALYELNLAIEEKKEIFEMP